jgi:hypothetical protein
MPFLRYFVCVGAVLLAALFVIGDGDGPPAQRATKAWTSTDSLRSMAHHGEPKVPSDIRTAIYRNP